MNWTCMYDHPSLPMAGDTRQLLKLQCHCKLAAKRIQRPKKGSKPDGSDDNGDATSAVDIRSGLESALLWVRVDPEMEYLAEIHFHQPVQMWSVPSFLSLLKRIDRLLQFDRPPKLYGVPRVAVHPMPDPESCSEPQIRPSMLKLKISKPQERPPSELTVISSEACHSAETTKEAEAVSNGTERRLPVVKIRVKQNSIIPRVDTEHLMENSQGRPIEVDLAGSSSASVDAPVRIMSEPVSISNQNVEEVNSSHDHGSRMTASVGSAKFVKEEDIGKELQCTADSKGVVLVDSKRVALEDRSSPSTKNDDVDREAKVKVKKKEKDGKRKRDDPEYLKRKRLKKEKTK
ncbi:Transcription initiation factor TFIID subunit 2 [Nymphaea thermarum]|nr:Transcription initiation factor TFIID subunit 2 [Nymphaea thermarum]